MIFVSPFVVCRGLPSTMQRTRAKHFSFFCDCPVWSCRCVRWNGANCDRNQKCIKNILFFSFFIFVICEGGVSVVCTLCRRCICTRCDECRRRHESNHWCDTDFAWNEIRIIKIKWFTIHSIHNAIASRRQNSRANCFFLRALYVCASVREYQPISIPFIASTESQIP